MSLYHENTKHRQVLPAIQDGFLPLLDCPLEYLLDLAQDSSARPRRGNDAPLIGERAATRRRSATEGGDEHAGAKSALIRSSSRIANGIKRREPVGGRSTPEGSR